MPALVALAAPIVGSVVATTLGGGFFAKVVGLAVTFAIGKLFAPSPKKPNVTSSTQSRRETGVLINSFSTVEPIPVIYGTVRVPGIFALQTTTGPENKYLQLVVVWGEGEIEEITELYLDERPVSEYGALVEYTHHLGSDSQAADTDLVNDISTWTNAHRLRGVAYSRVRIEFDPNEFGSIPTITADVKGRKVWNADTSVTEFSSNPAWIIRDYLTNTRFGVAIPEANIDDASFIAAAAHYDTTVEIPDGAGGTTNVAQFACNGIVDTTEEWPDILNQLRSSCRSWVVFSAGVYKLVPDKVDTPTTEEITDDMIIGRVSLSLGTQEARFNDMNAVFYNSAVDFTRDIARAPTAVSSTYLTADAGRYNLGEIDLPFTTCPCRAQIIAEIALKQSRQGITAELILDDRGSRFEVGDLVPVTYDVAGWVSKPFRVMRLRQNSDLTVTIDLTEYDSTVYSNSGVVERDAVPDTNLPAVGDVGQPTGLTLASGTDELLIGTDGSITSTILVTWVNSASPYIAYSEVQVKQSSEASTSWRTVGTVHRNSQPRFRIVGVLDSVDYDVRVRHINVRYAEGSWTEELNHNVVGKTEAPSAPDTFLVQRQPDGTREFRWTHLVPPADIYGYEIRYKAGTGHAWADMTPLHTGVLITSPWETNQLAAGQYTAEIRTVDTTGNYSTSGVQVVSTLGDPRIKNALATYDIHEGGYPAGTLNNCYVGPEGNLVANSATTWADLTTWAAWTAWNNGDPVTTFDYEYTEIDLGADVTFLPLLSVTVEGGNPVTEFQWKTAAGSYQGTWQAEPTAPITARYLKLRVTVTPTASVTLSRVTQMYLIINADVVEEEIVDLDTSTVSSPAGDLRLPITKTFAVITSVQVALQNVGAGWSWELIDKDATNGPRIKIYNSSDTLADATIDAIVKGA